MVKSSPSKWSARDTQTIPLLLLLCYVLLCFFWNSFIDFKDLWEPISIHDDHLLLFRKEAKIEIFFAFLIILHHAWWFALSSHGLVYPWTSIMVYMYISVFLFCFRGSINFLLLIFLGQFICTLCETSVICVMLAWTVISWIRAFTSFNSRLSVRQIFLFVFCITELSSHTLIEHNPKWKHEYIYRIKNSDPNRLYAKMDIILPNTSQESSHLVYKILSINSTLMMFHLNNPSCSDIFFKANVSCQIWGIKAAS